MTLRPLVSRFTPFVLVLVTLLLLLPSPASAHVPEGAVVYFRWAGVNADTPGYEGSNLQAMLRDTDLIGRVTRTMDAAIRAGGEQGADDLEVQEVRRAMEELAPVAWGRPWAVVFEGVDWGDDPDADAPVGFRASFLIAPGDQADAVRGWLEEAIKTYEGDEAMRPQLLDEAGVLGLMVGGKTDAVTRIAAALREPVGGGVGGGAGGGEGGGVKLMPEHTVEGAVYALYVDVSRGLSIIDDAVRRTNNDTDYQEWQSVRNASGLDGLKQVVVSGGFDGKMWRESAFIAAPAPRKGLLKLIDGEGLEPSDLAAIPASATWLRTVHFDPAATLDVVRELVAKTDQEGAERFDEGLAELKDELGFDLRADLLEPMGSQWMLYSDPSFGTEFGGNVPGIALVSPLDDANEVRTAMVKIEAKVDEQLQQNGSPLRFNTLDTGEVEVHSFTTPVISPAWLIADGRLVVALSPNAAMTAQTMAGQEGSIADSPTYKAVASKLPVQAGEGKLMGLMVVDLKKTALPMYTGYRALATMAQAAVDAQMADDFGGDWDMEIEEDPQPRAMQRDGGEGDDAAKVDVTQLLPPLNTLLPHLGPAGQTIRVDDAGVHIDMIQPFPGSTLLSPDVAVSGQTVMAPLTVGVMLPALGAARRSANRIATSNNARSITQAMAVYAEVNQNQLPDNFAVLIEDNYIVPETLLATGVSNAEAWEALEQVDQTDVAALDRWAREHGSFVMVPGTKNDTDAGMVLVFQKPSHSWGEGISVAWGDTHVTFEPMENAEAILKKQTGKTLEQLVEAYESGKAGEDAEAGAGAEPEAKRVEERPRETVTREVEIKLPPAIER